MSSTVQQCFPIPQGLNPDVTDTGPSTQFGLNATVVNSHMGSFSMTARLANLIAEHDDLDQAVASMLSALSCDDISISRLKKRKLAVKDEISRAQAYLRGLAAGFA